MEAIKQLLDALPAHLPYNPRRQQIAEQNAKISKVAFEVLTALFTAVAVLAAALRIALHIRKRGKLFGDDYLVIFAAACLIIDTGILYYVHDRLFYIEVLVANPLNFGMFTKSELLSMLNLTKWLNIFLAFAWTANFAIKLSFLEFFRNLIRNVSKRLYTYWWGVLIFTLLGWLFNVIQNPLNVGWTTGPKTFKAFPGLPHNLELGWTCLSIDIAADLMVISIPILLLRKSMLALHQKLRILLFLCLNAFMIAIAITRVAAGIRRGEHGDKPKFGTVMSFFLLHVESSVGVIMGGVTAFRTVFASHIHRSESQRGNVTGLSFYYRIKSWLGRSRSRSGSPGFTPDISKEERKGGYLAGPATGGTIAGLKTFIRRYGRDPGQTTMGGTVDGTVDEPHDGLVESYHAYLKEERPGSSTKGSVKPSQHKSTNSNGNHDLRAMPAPTLQVHNLV